MRVSYVMLASLSTTALLSAVAAAQCEASFNGGLGLPGVGNGYADPILVWNDGTRESLYVGGSFAEIGGAFINCIARYDEPTDSWRALGTGLNLGSTNGFVTSIVSTTIGSSTGRSRLIVGGRFTSAGGQPFTEGIAAWDGQRWESIGLNVAQGNAVWDIAVGDVGQGPRLFVAGNLGVGFNGISQWDGEAWLPVGTGTGINGVFSPYIADLEIFDDGSGPALYAVGRFDTVDGVAAQLAARFKNGAWQRIGLGLSRQSDALKYLDSATVFNNGSGASLYVGGTQFGIQAISGSAHVARWNGTNWAFVGQSLGTGRVSALRGWNDGNGQALYFAGTAFPGINNFGKLVQNTWTSVQGSLRDSSTPNSSTSGNWPSAFGLGIWRDSLVISGSFITIGPTQARGLATLQACCPCPADFNRDGSVEGSDVEAFFVSFESGLEPADVDCSGGVDGTDVQYFFSKWETGGCE